MAEVTANRELKIPLSEIAPFACQRPQDVKRYLGLLQRGKQPPLIWVHEIKPPSKYKHWISDGVHRVEAARQAGHKYINARICHGLHEMVHTRNGLRARIVDA